MRIDNLSAVCDFADRRSGRWLRCGRRSLTGHRRWRTGAGQTRAGRGSFARGGGRGACRSTHGTDIGERATGGRGRCCRRTLRTGRRIRGHVEAHWTLPLSAFTILILPLATAEQRHSNKRAVERRWYAKRGKIHTALKSSRRLAKRYSYLPCDPTTVRPPYDNRCDHCGKETTRLRLDHDHVTGKFRGWLCNDCNLAFGRFGDSVEGMRRGIAYLEGRLVRSS